MNLFTGKGSGPSPLERGWGEVTQAQYWFLAFTRTVTIVYNLKIQLFPAQIHPPNRFGKISKKNTGW
jgi:hypothetical protein